LIIIQLRYLNDCEEKSCLLVVDRIFSQKGLVPFFVLIAASMAYGILYPLFANGQSTSEAVVWGTLLIVAAILLLLAKKNPHYIGIERK
jgi:hypothetical protein